MFKTIILILFLILLAGCASTECRQLQNLMFKTDECSTGWSVYGITGHPPDCLDEKSYEEIKEVCPNF